MSKIAILYICTGEYSVFFSEFYESFEKNFLTNSKKEYFVFTDAPPKFFETSIGNIHVIYTKMRGWPYDTLFRFELFSAEEESLKEFDYLFFMNANTLCCDIVKEEEILPQKENLVMVQHPAFYESNNKKFTYERNRKSTAYIRKGEGRCYVCGGVNGGKTFAYLELINTLKYNIQVDLANGIIARWHDESHLNRYILERSDVMLLPASYCYPEGWELPFSPKIKVRDKKRYLNVERIKGGYFTYLKEYILHLK